MGSLQTPVKSKIPMLQTIPGCEGDLATPGEENAGQKILPCSKTLGNAFSDVVLHKQSDNYPEKVAWAPRNPCGRNGEFA